MGRDYPKPWYFLELIKTSSSIYASIVTPLIIFVYYDEVFYILRKVLKKQTTMIGSNLTDW